jgi:hypothetical protein
MTKPPTRGATAHPRRATIAAEVAACLARLTGLPRSHFTRSRRVDSFAPEAVHRRAMVNALLIWPGLQRHGLVPRRFNRAAVTGSSTVGDLVRLVSDALSIATTPSATEDDELPISIDPSHRRGTTGLKQIIGDSPSGAGLESFDYDMDVERDDSLEASPPPLPPAPSPPRRAPRHANVLLREAETDAPIDPRSSWWTSGLARLRIDIGPLSADSKAINPQQFPEDRLPRRDLEINVVVSSSDLAISANRDALLGEGAEPKTAEGLLLLPANGDPARTTDGGTYLYFFVRTRKDREPPPLLRARAGFYFRNHLVQSQQLSFDRQTGDYSVAIDFTTSDDLTGLDDREEQERVSIFTGASEGASRQLVLRHAQPTPHAVSKTAAIEIKSENVDQTVKQIRRYLDQSAPTRKLRSKSQLQNDLTELARLGRSLYTQVTATVPAGVFRDLRKSPERIVVEVARPTASSFTLPWNYLYEIPLYSGATYTLCPLVQDWDGTRPLFEGAPRTCPCGPHDRNIICPFGFWGYRYMIEQLSKADSPVATLPLAHDSRIVVGETLHDVDRKKLAAHVAKLRKMFQADAPDVQLLEGDSRAKLETMLGSDLPLVYFYCHGRHSGYADPNVVLHVGNNESITADDFHGWTEAWSDAQGTDVWGTVRPLVFINACSSLAIERATAVSYLDVMIGRARAAGVIGTEVKVQQDLAMDVAESFFASMLAGKTVDESLRSIRLDYLKQGNMFGLVYTPYCRSDLKIVRA